MRRTVLIKTKKASGIWVLGGLFLKCFYSIASSNHASLNPATKAYNRHRLRAAAGIHPSLLECVCELHCHGVHLRVKNKEGALRHFAMVPLCTPQVNSRIPFVKSSQPASALFLPFYLRKAGGKKPDCNTCSCSACNCISVCSELLSGTLCSPLVGLFCQIVGVF